MQAYIYLDIHARSTKREDALPLLTSISSNVDDKALETISTSTNSLYKFENSAFDIAPPLSTSYLRKRSRKAFLRSMTVSSDRFKESNDEAFFQFKN